MFFYVTMFALFLGVFIIRYHLELILFAPFVSGFITQYVRVGLNENSSTQNPERLYRERNLMVYLIVCVVVFVLLMFVEIPALYHWFNVEPSRTSPLWRI
jgi:hypothetical protein